MLPKKKKTGDLVKEFGDREVRDNFVLIDETTVSRAVEVPVKEEPIVEVVEETRKPVKKPTKKRKTRKTTKKRKTLKKTIGNWKEKFKIPGPKKLKERGVTLIITEKPQSAVKIADALADGSVEKHSANGVSYYELQRNNEEIVVACAVGHLFTLAQVHPRNKWPTFEIEWAPTYLVRKTDFTKKYYDVIAKLCKQASKIVVATDYDIEGEVIGMNIVKYICNQPDAERMKYSTLTATEIQESYDHKSKTLDWQQGIAGEARHYLDWMYGINLSRALMAAIKETGQFRLMSIGRVQGPALGIIVKKEKEILAFKPETYWQVFADVDDGETTIEVKHVRDITDKELLPEFEELKDKKGNAETKKTQRIVTPLSPFDLTSLQMEAYKFYKITPSKTLESAQRLYLSGAISYPRTSSQKIPKEIGYQGILNRLKNKFEFVNQVTRTIPIEGYKTDPAHPSIYPTGEFHSLSGDDQKIYQLIVKRFVSCFCDDALIDDKRIKVEIEGKKFSAKGTSIAKKGWMSVYPSVLKEIEIPDLEGSVIVRKIKIDEKLTQPPKRYTPASLISELEKRNLGTKATRSSIVETLYNRGYVSGKSIEATALGIALVDTLEENCPIIVDEKLTRDIENELDEIRESMDLKAKKEEIIKENQDNLIEIGKYFEKNKMKIGNDLVKATSDLYEKEKKDNEIMTCKVCEKGQLTIKYGRAYKRYFVACDAYPDCRTTYTLPPNSLIKPNDKFCDVCGWKMLISLKKRKKPWIFCFNPDCETRKKD